MAPRSGRPGSGRRPAPRRRCSPTAQTAAGTGPDAAPWPEFAEYECAGCHHPLAAQARPDRTRGQLQWGSWYFSMSGAVPGADEPTAAALRGLQTVMERRRPPAEAEQAALATVGLLHAAALPLPGGDPWDEVRAGLLRERRARPPGGGDEARQWTLAAAAVALPRQKGMVPGRVPAVHDQPTRAALDPLLRRLFAGGDGPGAFVWDREFDGQLDALFDHLNRAPTP